MKKCLLILVVVSLIVFKIISIVYADNITKSILVTYRNISILVNRKQIKSDKEPFIYQGSVFAPIRTIGEAVNKKVEWDNKTNQVNITDQEPASLSFPIHKIGERVYMYPYAITINKVYSGTKHKGKSEFNSEMLFIEYTIESLSKNIKMISSSRPFTIWDENNNKIAVLGCPGIGHIYGIVDAFAYCKLDDTIKNRNLILVFYPVDTEHGDPVDEINVFMAFDIGKIE